MGEQYRGEAAFSPRRIFLLLKRDFVHGYSGVLIAMAAVGGVMLLFSFLSMLGGAGRPEYYTPFFAGLLFLGGFISTSGVFRELHQPGSGPFYLTLPGTLVEKLLSKLLVSGLGFAIATLLFMGGISAVSELINRAVFGKGHGLFNPVAPDNLRAAATYLVVQSMYLLGSIWFRKVAFIKTALAQVILLIGFAIIAGVTFRLVFGSLFTGSGPGSQMGNMFSFNFGSGAFITQGSGALQREAQVFSTILRVCFWALLAPFCWVASYFRLRETEV